MPEISSHIKPLGDDHSLKILRDLFPGLTQDDIGYLVLEEWTMTDPQDLVTFDLMDWDVLLIQIDAEPVQIVVPPETPGRYKQEWGVAANGRTYEPGMVLHVQKVRLCVYGQPLVSDIAVWHGGTSEEGGGFFPATLDPETALRLVDFKHQLINGEDPPTACPLCESELTKLDNGFKCFGCGSIFQIPKPQAQA